MYPFPVASKAHTFSSVNAIPVINEIHHIQLAIIDAIDEGDLECTIIDSTMTTPDDDDLTSLPVKYWKVWKGQLEDRALEMRMDQVITFFTGLGYSITRAQSTTADYAFRWVITW